MRRRTIVFASFLLVVLLVGRTAAGRLGGGLGYVPGPPVSTVTSAPNGGWTQIQEPKAYYYNGWTYIGYIDGTSGAIEVVAYEHATKTPHGPFAIADLGTPDNHDAPALHVRASDHKLMVFYCRHDGASLFVRVSTTSLDTDPDLGDGFAAAVNLDSQLGSSDYTYPVVYEDSAGIHLLWRDVVSNTGRLAHSVSADGVSGFPTRTLIITGASAGLFPYWRMVSNGTDRIDVFTTDIEPAVSSELYHFYIDTSDNTYYQSDGTQITASLPWAPAAEATLVLSNSAGPSWSWGASWDGTAPATIIMQSISGIDNRVKVARWRSGAWQVDTVVNTVGGILASNQYGSGVAINHGDPDTVYIAIKATRWEMWRYTTINDGASWQASALSTASSADNVWPDSPWGAATGLSVVWLYGTYSSDTVFSFGLRGAR